MSEEFEIDTDTVLQMVEDLESSSVENLVEDGVERTIDCLFFFIDLLLLLVTVIITDQIEHLHSPLMSIFKCNFFLLRMMASNLREPANPSLNLCINKCCQHKRLISPPLLRSCKYVCQTTSVLGQMLLLIFIS